MEDGIFPPVDAVLPVPLVVPLAVGGSDGGVGGGIDKFEV